MEKYWDYSPWIVNRGPIRFKRLLLKWEGACEMNSTSRVWSACMRDLQLAWCRKEILEKDELNDYGICEGKVRQLTRELRRRSGCKECVSLTVQACRRKLRVHRFALATWLRPRTASQPRYSCKFRHCPSFRTAQQRHLLQPTQSAP